MKDYLWPAIAVVIAMAAFTYFWRQGAFLRLSAYWNETMEELKKCTWPTWDELRGSTVVVIVSVGLLGAFTIMVDFLVSGVIKVIVH
jgi:preprotein translocase subunit SecE